ncbi:hypothetical protein HOU26_gp28 [Escherichia phage IMM-002]|uniref:Uncharacterized protein n=1 Tax=Escherichia phage IMM-002 TaxID=2041760 RepID=A0A384X890_9CAUD|nr:hypothetical protein HOU26_gp28 [Escherichia phage IMM-002]ATI16987.1 hypothetical protein [Escherichia phage IMM-002]
MQPRLEVVVATGRRVIATIGIFTEVIRPEVTVSRRFVATGADVFIVTPATITTSTIAGPLFEFDQQNGFELQLNACTSRSVPLERQDFELDFQLRPGANIRDVTDEFSIGVVEP